MLPMPALLGGPLYFVGWPSRGAEVTSFRS
jgi:hypothetical protein